jgi:hypothetical protein
MQRDMLYAEKIVAIRSSHGDGGVGSFVFIYQRLLVCVRYSRALAMYFAQASSFASLS